MTRDDILSQMTDAGLTRPRVMLSKLRDNSLVFDLYAGEGDDRRTVRVPRKAEPADVAKAIEGLK